MKIPCRQVRENFTSSWDFPRSFVFIFSEFWEKVLCEQRTQYFLSRAGNHRHSIKKGFSIARATNLIFNWIIKVFCNVSWKQFFHDTNLHLRSKISIEWLSERGGMKQKSLVTEVQRKKQFRFDISNPIKILNQEKRKRRASCCQFMYRLKLVTLLSSSSLSMIRRLPTAWSVWNLFQRTNVFFLFSFRRNSFTKLQRRFLVTF